MKTILILYTVLFTRLLVFAQETGKAAMSPNKDNAVSQPESPTSLPAKWTRFVKVRQPDLLKAWTTDNDHEDAGIETYGGGPFLGVDAVHTVYKDGAFQLEPPAGATEPQTLFAPTTRPPNGSCLEVGTAYTTEIGKKTSTNIYVYNFCTSEATTVVKCPLQLGQEISPSTVTNDHVGAFVVSCPVNATFMKRYAGGSVSGIPAYQVEIYTLDTDLTGVVTWNADILNFETNKWETLFTAQGYYDSDVRGWSIFETWYHQGQCSRSIPVMSAARILYYNAQTRKWDPIADNMSQLQNSLHRGGACFNSNPVSYKVEELTPDQAWKVTSTGD